MNRYLLAGCAAVALAMGSGAANAQAKFEVKVGGDAFAEWGWVDQDRDAGLRSTEMRNRFRVNIIPSAKADNGLEYGARLRIRADAATRGLTQDKAYIFAQGGFGQVRIGNETSFNDNTIVSRPIDYLPFGLYNQADSFLNQNARSSSVRNQGADVSNSATTGSLATATAPATLGTGTSLATNYSSMTWPTIGGETATRIVYFSPRIAGFQLGGSYTPRNDDSTNSVNRLKTGNALAVSTVQTSFQDIWEIGANYDANFGGVGVKVGAGYYAGQAADVANASFRNLRAWQAGAQVSFAGFALGGSYSDFGKSGFNKALGNVESGRVYQLGAQYTMGPVVIGAGWMRGSDAGDVFVSGRRKLDVYEIGASYTVAPGLAVQAQYDYFKADSDRANTVALGQADDKGSIVLLRTTLAF